METIVGLRKMFSYSTTPLIVVGCALGAVTLIIIIYILVRIIKKLIKNAQKPKPVVREEGWVKPDLNKLKAEYTGRLNTIGAEFEKDTADIRGAYEKMSITVREFAYKATGVEVDKYTLREIKDTEYGALAELVEEFYEPEFDKISAGDVRMSIEKSRRLVQEWN